MSIYQDSSNASLDTIQLISSATSTAGIAWGSTIQTNFTAIGQTLTLPTIGLSDVGKSITVNNTGTNSFLLAIASGTITTSIGLTINPGTTFVIKAVDVLTAVIIATNSAQAPIAEYGRSVLPSDVTVTSTSFFDIGLSITLPSAGTWLIGYNSTVQNSGLFLTYLQITDNASVVLTSTVQSADNGTNVRAGISASEIVTVAVPTTYKMSARVGSGTGTVFGLSNGQGNTVMTYQKISGTTPTNGQLVESTYFKQLNTQGIPVNGTPLNFESIDGTTPLTSGTTFTLTANRQYYLTGAAGAMNGNAARFSVQFFNVTTGLFIGAPATYSSPTSGGINTPISGIAAAKILPTVTTQIQLRVTDVGNILGVIGGSNLVPTAGAGSVDAPNSANWVKVTQEGSAAYTVLNPVNLTTTVTNILPIVNGGTNAATAIGGLNNLLPSQSGNATKSLVTDGTNATWQVMPPQVTFTTTTTTGAINVTNTTYMQLTAMPAGVYDISYKMTLSNADANTRLWATGVTVNNAAQVFSTGADGTCSILGTLNLNHPFTVVGYQQVTVTAGSTIEVKGQIYGSQSVSPPFAGTCRLTATKIN